MNNWVSLLPIAKTNLKHAVLVVGYMVWWTRSISSPSMYIGPAFSVNMRSSLKGVCSSNWGHDCEDCRFRVGRQGSYLLCGCEPAFSNTLCCSNGHETDESDESDCLYFFFGQAKQNDTRSTFCGTLCMLASYTQPLPGFLAAAITATKNPIQPYRASPLHKLIAHVLARDLVIILPFQARDHCRQSLRC